MVYEELWVHSCCNHCNPWWHIMLTLETELKRCIMLFCVVQKGSKNVSFNVQWWPKLLQHLTDVEISTLNCLQILKNAHSCSENNKYQMMWVLPPSLKGKYSSWWLYSMVYRATWHNDDYISLDLWVNSMANSTKTTKTSQMMTPMMSAVTWSRWFFCSQPTQHAKADGFLA